MKRFIFILLVIFTCLLMLPVVQADDIDDSIVIINDEKIPGALNRNGRLLVPARSAFEAADASIEWLPDERKVIIKRDGTTIELLIGSKTIKVINADSSNTIEGDTAPEIINGTTYVPLSLVAESLGAEVSWNAEERTANITFVSTSYDIGSFDLNAGGKIVKLGDSKEDTVSQLGEYIQNSSVYSYLWQTYDINGQKFFVGMDGENVAAYYSNAKNASIAGIRPGMSALELNAAVKGRLPKNRVNVIENELGKLTIYRNSLQDYAVIGILAQGVKYTKVNYDYNDNFHQEALEEQLVDIINTWRINLGIAPFTVDKELTAAARGHSMYMAAKGVISHEDNTGKDPFERMEKMGITNYNMASENIGGNCIDGIEMFAEWLNHNTYAVNMTAENYNLVGIGAASGGRVGRLYFTADFIER